MRFSVFLFLIAVVILLIVFVGGLAYLTWVPQSVPEDNRARLSPAPSLSFPTRPVLRATDPVRGNPQARLIIVEFGDYFCPACAAVETTLQKILQSQAGKVRLLWKDLPNETRHPLARRASEASRCVARQNSALYWTYHDRLLQKQTELFDEARLVALAQELPLDFAEFQTCLTQGVTRFEVDRDIKEALLLKVDATPYFFIGAKRFSGQIDEVTFKKILEGL